MKYTEPVRKLIKLGEPAEDQLNKNWIDYSTLGISEKDIPELLELLQDLDLYYQDASLPDIWAALHAWRALGQLKAKEAVLPLLNLLEEFDDDDWFGEEVPYVFNMIGEESIVPLKDYFYDDSKQEFPRSTAAQALQRIAENIPSKKEECIDMLSTFLSQSTSKTQELNAFVVSFLTELMVVDKIDVISDAYKRNIIDCSISGDLEDAEISLGLREERTSPPRNYFGEKYLGLPYERETKKIGRNEPCPCGSGKKYKKCCLNKAQ